jgi:uncharacterized alpha-E superfamily protein
MLSRIAESFFWIGRYVERAHATSRLLAEHHQLMVEDRSVPEEVACAVLLDAMSMPHVEVETAGELVMRMMGGPGNSSTVAGAVAAARENARAVRDVLSGEVFEALNATHLSLTRGIAFADSPGVSLHRIVERLLVVHGVVAWAMPRDESYQFLKLGRSLERIDMTARLLAVRHDQLWPESGPVATLRAAAAYSPFLRSGFAMEGDDVRRFLVLDPALPRSMHRSAVDAEEAVRALGVLGAGDGGDLLREVGLLRSALEYAVAPNAHEVERLAVQARESAARASDIADEAFFRQSGTIIWSH